MWPEPKATESELNLLKVRREDRGLQKCFLFEPKTEAKASLSRSCCAWSSLIPACTEPAGQGRLALGSCASENQSNDLPHVSILVSLVP